MDQNKIFAGRKYAEYIRDFTSLGNPFILLSIAFLVAGATQAYAIILLGFVLNEVTCSTIKYYFPKARPNQQSYETGLEKIDAGSFPSIHASRLSFVMFSLISLTTFLPYKILFGLMMLIVGYSRIFLKKHFFVDVVSGYAFGALLFLVLSNFW